MIHHVLECEQTSDVGFGFFDRAEKILQLFAGSSVAALDFDLMRPQPVHKLVGHGVGEERFETHIQHCSFGSVLRAMGSSALRNLASWIFFIRTRLLPFCCTTRSSLGRL